MNISDDTSKSKEGAYLTKQVLLNGQFVTLYSSNGQTWLSSPEDIPNLMDRLDHERTSLFNGEKSEDAKDSSNNSDKGNSKDGAKSETKVAAPNAKYRSKGPKPRPILEQNGKVFTGPPAEPVSASEAVLTFSSDPTKVKEASKTTGKTNRKRKVTKAQMKKLLTEVTTEPGQKNKKTKKASVGGSKKEASKKVAKSQTNRRETANKGAKQTLAKAAKTPAKKSKTPKRTVTKAAQTKVKKGKATAKTNKSPGRVSKKNSDNSKTNSRSKTAASVKKTGAQKKKSIARPTKTKTKTKAKAKDDSRSKSKATVKKKASTRKKA